jgi:hypothetical protein
MAIVKVAKLSHDQARDVLREAYKKLFHREPSDGELDFGLSTAYFESGYGRAGSANWAKPGQFAKWSAEGLYNWGALESGSPKEDAAFNQFRSAGLHPVKRPGQDAGRKSYFYLFPSDLEAAQAFLMTWGKPATLKAAATGDAHAVAKSMKDRGYYEGYWVPPGNPEHKPMPPFKEAHSAEEANQNNIRDYAGALQNHVAVVSNKAPSQQHQKPSSGFMAQLYNLLHQFSLASQESHSFLVSVGSSDYDSSVEYARVLSAAIEEYLDAKTAIHAGEDHIEIECKIIGDKEITADALTELSAAISDAFEYATRGMGSITTFASIAVDSKSKYDLLHPRTADLHYRKFKLKIARTK